MMMSTSAQSFGFLLTRLSAGVFAALASVVLHAQVEGSKTDWVRYEDGAHFHYQKEGSDAKVRISPNSSIPSGNGALFTRSGDTYTFKLSSNVHRIEYRGKSYRSGVVQLEGEVKVASGTDACNFAQFWHAGLIRTDGGRLEYHTASDLKRQVPSGDRVVETSKNIVGRWVKINIVHDASNNRARIYLDESTNPVVDVKTGKTTTEYYIKYGAYGNDGPGAETIQWRNVKVYKKK
jgi:hypothetical protein